jgi:ubiquinone/menaquinone biosynthesis C-methylase UbiE
VVGIDVAMSMIKLANEITAQNEVSHICSFIQADFLAWQPGKRFDYALAIGFMDYVAEPERFLRLMLAHTSSLAVLSFPTRCWWRFRKLRYRLNKCPLWLYDRRKIETLLSRVPHQHHEIEKIPGEGYDFVVSIVP